MYYLMILMGAPQQLPESLQPSWPGSGEARVRAARAGLQPRARL